MATYGHTSDISARNVIGTTVKDDTGRKIGQIENVMVDRQSGEILFAVVVCGGFVRAPQLSHRIPWRSLQYQESENAYLVDYSDETLTRAPRRSLGPVTPRDVAAQSDRGSDTGGGSHYYW